jgi:taurine dioxygenase
VNITKMRGPFGAIVNGVDAARPLNDATMQSLASALHENHILLMEGQDVTPAQYAAFGRRWGEPISFFSPSHRDATLPELITITNSPSTPDVSRDGALHWHSDSSYEAVPASVTMLYAVEAPRIGNDTLFADTTASYESLPEDLKQRVGSLEVIHDPAGGKVDTSGEKRGRGRTEPRPIVTHPLVMKHPVTGRKSLFGFSGTAAGIVGCEESEAIELLLRVKSHVLQERFMQRAAARRGTILLWDNFSVIHSATPTSYSDADGQRRFLYRISTRGLPSVFASSLPTSARL